MFFAPLALSFAQGPTPDLIVVQPNPVVLFDNYDLSMPSNCAGYPLGSGCQATFVGTYYPDNQGPASLGYGNPPSPVVIVLRGGNSNPEVPNQLAWFQTYVLPKGFVGVDPNFVTVKPGEDYMVSATGIGYLIQYLRYYHEWLNIDPNRIFLFGRSFGCILSFAVGLKQDYQNLASPDPILHEKSRPDYIIPFSGMTDITCLSGQVDLFDYLLQLFPVALAPGATYQQKLDDSAVWWLANPQLYGRTYTPPMCLGYNVANSHPCGQIDDAHDGYFGKLMRDKVDDFVDVSNNASLGLSSQLIDTLDVYALTGAIAQALDWATAQLVPKTETMYLIPPKTPIGPTGSFQTLKVIGAAPGSLVGYFFGFQAGPVLLPMCANIIYGLPVFYSLGWRVADGQGKATLMAFAPPAAIGLDLLLHVADFQNCAVSEVLHKKWTE